MAVTLYAPSAGEEVRATHVAQFVNLHTGASGGGALVRLYDVSDSASYSVVVGNQDTTNGYALKIQYGPVATPTTLATFAKGGSRVQSASGSHYLDVSNSGVVISGTLTLNGSTIGSGIRAFNVLDYGITTSTDLIEESGSAIRANNNTQLATVMTAVEAADGGEIFFPSHTINRFYPFNPVTLSHTTGAGITVGLRGQGQSSILQFYGTTSGFSGAYLNLAGSAANPFRQSWIRDLVLQATPSTTAAFAITTGALLQVQTAFGYDVENCWFRHGWRGIEIGAGSLTGITAIPQNVRIRNVDLDLKTSSTDSAVVLRSAAGISLVDSTFDGSSSGTIGLRVVPDGTNVTATGYSAFDTLWVRGCNFKDHKTGLRMGEAGLVANVMFSNSHLDGIGAAGVTNAVALHIETAGAATVENVQVSDAWMAVNATTTGYGALVSDATGAIRNVQIRGNYWTGPVSGAIVVQGSPVALVITGNLINGAAAAGVSEIDVAAGDRIVIANNVVQGQSTSGYGIFAASGVTNLLVHGNISTGKTSGVGFAGTTSATRIFANNISN